MQTKCGYMVHLKLPSMADNFIECIEHLVLKTLRVSSVLPASLGNYYHEVDLGHYKHCVGVPIKVGGDECSVLLFVCQLL